MLLAMHLDLHHGGKFGGFPGDLKRMHADKGEYVGLEVVHAQHVLTRLFYGLGGQDGREGIAEGRPVLRVVELQLVETECQIKSPVFRSGGRQVKESDESGRGKDMIVPHCGSPAATEHIDSNRRLARIEGEDFPIRAIQHRIFGFQFRLAVALRERRSTRWRSGRYDGAAQQRYRGSCAVKRSQNLL